MMRPNNIPEEKTSPILAIGVVFIAVGIAMLGANNTACGVTFFILGVSFLIGQQSARGKEGKGNPPGTFPSEPQVRESQAASERKLRGEALAPDGKSNFPARQTPPAQTPPAPMREPKVRESQAASERKLRDEALAPDGNSRFPVQMPSTPMQKPDVRMNANEAEKRKEELRSLLESGIITKDEYRDRVRNLR